MYFKDFYFFLNMMGFYDFILGLCMSESLAFIYLYWFLDIPFDELKEMENFLIQYVY